MYKIMDQSEELRNERMLLPFKDLTEGKSIAIPMKGVNEQELRNLICYNNKKYKRRFRVVKHKELGIYEVGCISNELKPYQIYNSSEKLMKVKKGG